MSTAGLDAAVAATVARAASAVPAFAARLAAAGLAPDELRTVDDLVRLPVLTKDALATLQRENPPFGGLVAAGAAVRRVFASPGPLYEPQLAGVDPWRWAPAMTAAGIGAGDVVVNCFGYHLSPAGAMFDEAATAVGATVLPAGVGSLEAQARAVLDLGVTAYTGLPSYLLALAQAAARLDGRAWAVRRALVTAEPLPPTLRRQLMEFVPRVLMAYGTAECGLIAYEREPDAGLVVPDGTVVQVCDVDTGEPLEQGVGQVVVTLLRPEYPLVRFGTGDLSEWVPLAGGGRGLAGVLGRVGLSVKVRGMFVHPGQAASVLADVPQVARHRFVVDREGHRDRLRCEVVLTEGVGADGDAGQQVLAVVAERVRATLRVGADVVPVDALADGGPVLVDERVWD